jgi:hypothetical protein
MSASTLEKCPDLWVVVVETRFGPKLVLPLQRRLSSSICSVSSILRSICLKAYMNLTLCLTNYDNFPYFSLNMHAPVYKTEITSVESRCADQARTSTRKRRHYFAGSGCRSIGMVPFGLKTTEFVCLFICLFVPLHVHETRTEQDPLTNPRPGCCSFVGSCGITASLSADLVAV